MKQSKLVEILKTYSKEEFKMLEKFVSSSYHRKRDVSKLFYAIKDFYPKFDSEKFSNKFVYEKLFPRKKYGDKKSDSLLKTLSSDLFLLCKDFLIQTGLNDNIAFKKYFLLDQLRKRKLHKEFHREACKIKNMIDLPGGDTSNFLEKYYLMIPVIEYFIDTNEFKKSYENIINQIEYLAAAALTRSLRFSDQRFIAENGYNFKTRVNLIQSLLNHLDTESLINELQDSDNPLKPYIEINYIIHKIRTEKPSDNYFYKIKNLLEKYDNIFSHTEKYIYYAIIADYGYDTFYHSKNKKYNKEMFEIYNIMLEKGVYKYNPDDHFQLGLFRSMLIEARVCKEFDWMKKLIDNHIHELHPDHIDNMRSYSMGQYYFSIGEFGKALENLIVVKSDYFLYKKDLKNLLFRIYFNLGFYEEAYSVLDTLKHYISGTKDLSEKIIIHTRNFIVFASELLRIKTGNQENNSGYLLKKIKNDKFVESKDWLIEKFEEINTVKKNKQTFNS